MESEEAKNTVEKPSAYIAKVKFSDDSVFVFSKTEKVILVGPNNGGKSQSLREIVGHASSDKNMAYIVVREVDVQKNGSSKELEAFLEAEAELVDGAYRYRDWSIYKTHTQFWTQEKLPHGIHKGFIRRISADERLKICEQQNSISPGEQKSKPQHVLYDDEALMTNISGLFRKAFGKDLMFDFRGGSRMPIHVGQIPRVEGGVDRVGDTYVKSVRENPLLDKQGDGMKSYAGILFDAVVSNLDVTLIDEPEAFLHPPQMRKLGETLSSEVQGQLIVATHSSDIMRGFLEGTKGNVRVLRIQRDGSKNLVSEASSSVVRELWERPELRYSNALDGIFHEQTIICEDDSDCRLLNAYADYLSARTSSQWKDTAYIPTGGKHGIPKVASVLRRIGVPIKAVFDIDFLAERQLVSDTVGAFGGDWVLVREAWERVDAAVRDGVKAKSVEEIKREICLLLDEAGAGNLPRSDVIELMKQTKPWALVKRFGEDAIPRGNAQDDYKRLIATLEGIGIYIIPVGEIENFCRSIGSHGPKYVTNLLSSIDFGSDSVTELRSFVEKVHSGPHCAK